MVSLFLVLVMVSFRGISNLYMLPRGRTSEIEADDIANQIETYPELRQLEDTKIPDEVWHSLEEETSSPKPSSAPENFTQSTTPSNISTRKEPHHLSLEENFHSVFSEDDDIYFETEYETSTADTLGIAEKSPSVEHSSNLANSIENFYDAESSGDYSSFGNLEYPIIFVSIDYVESVVNFPKDTEGSGNIERSSEKDIEDVENYGELESSGEFQSSGDSENIHQGAIETQSVSVEVLGRSDILNRRDPTDDGGRTSEIEADDIANQIETYPKLHQLEDINIPGEEWHSLEEETNSFKASSAPENSTQSTKLSNISTRQKPYHLSLEENFQSVFNEVDDIYFEADSTQNETSRQVNQNTTESTQNEFAKHLENPLSVTEVSTQSEFIVEPQRVHLPVIGSDHVLKGTSSYNASKNQENMANSVKYEPTNTIRLQKVDENVSPADEKNYFTHLEGPPIWSEEDSKKHLQINIIDHTEATQPFHPATEVLAQTQKNINCTNTSLCAHIASSGDTSSSYGHPESEDISSSDTNYKQQVGIFAGFILADTFGTAEKSRSVENASNLANSIENFDDVEGSGDYSGFGDLGHSIIIVSIDHVESVVNFPKDKEGSGDIERSSEKDIGDVENSGELESSGEFQSYGHSENIHQGAIVSQSASVEVLEISDILNRGDFNPTDDVGDWYFNSP